MLFTNLWPLFLFIFLIYFRPFHPVFQFPYLIKLSGWENIFKMFLVIQLLQPFLFFIPYLTKYFLNNNLAILNVESKKIWILQLLLLIYLCKYLCLVNVISLMLDSFDNHFLYNIAVNMTHSGSLVLLCLEIKILFFSNTLKDLIRVVYHATCCRI